VADVRSAGTKVEGETAHDSPIGTLNPVVLGARANANEPADVSADDDVVALWGDRRGRLVVLLGHANPESPVALNATASGNTTVIAAPGAGSLYVCKGLVNNGGTAKIVVLLTDGTGGTTRWRAELAADGGGARFDFGSRGWKLTATTALVTNLSAGGNVNVNVEEYYIAP
jgi:hypothetical protein